MVRRPVATGSRPRISRLHVRIDDPKLDYDVLIDENMQVTSIKFDDADAYELLLPVKLQITPGSIFPDMTVVRNKKQERISQERVFFYEREEFSEPIKKFLSANLKRLKDRWLDSFSNALFHVGTRDKKEILAELGHVGPKVWQRVLGRRVWR